jgi:hypothetical protein
LQDYIRKFGKYPLLGANGDICNLTILGNVFRYFAIMKMGITLLLLSKETNLLVRLFSQNYPRSSLILVPAWRSQWSWNWPVLSFLLLLPLAATFSSTPA